MVIQCPACTTGFNLPDKHINAKGAKLRCSKCGHVFRIRRADPDADIEIYYKPEDQEANAASGTTIEVPEGGGPALGSPVASEAMDDEDLSEANKTQFGVGTFADSAAEIEDGDPPTMELDAPMMEDIQSQEREVPEDEGGSTALGGSLKGLFGEESEPTDDDPFPHAKKGGLKGLLKKAPRPDGTPDDDSGAAREETTEDAPIGGVAREPTPSQGDAAPSDQPAAAPQQSVEIDESALAAADQEAVDLFDDGAGEEMTASDDPFGGAFDDGGVDGDFDFGDISSAQSDEQKEEDTILRPGQPGMAAQWSTAQEISSPASASLSSQELAAPSSPTTTPSAGSSQERDLWNNQEGGFGSAEDLVDPNFGADGPSFDPEQRAMQPESQAPLASAGPPSGKPPNARAKKAPRQPASRGPSARQEPQPSAATQKDEDVWPGDIETVAPHKIGGGGLQKAANVLLITLIVLVSFLSVVAALNGGFLDFKQFGSMIDVAFGDGTYELREAWLPNTKPAPVPPKKDLLRTESVYVEVVPVTRRDNVLMVRGKVRNLDQQEYIDVRLRAVLLNAKDKIIAEEEAPLGAFLSNAQLKEAKDVDAAMGLLPESPEPLDVASTQPFTIVFDEIPKDVTEGDPLLYRVEFTKRVGKQDLATD